MARKDQDRPGIGSGIALILITAEVFAAFFSGMMLMDRFGSESVTAMKSSGVGAGFAGVMTYILLHIIPGIRWLMMGAMIVLWGFAAYTLGLFAIGEAQEGLRLVSHKGPYIAAAIAAAFRAMMYR